MTEEQRWKMQHQIEMDRNKCLKGIWDELKNIAGLLKVQGGVAPVCDVERLSNICRSGYILTKKEEEKVKCQKRDGDYQGAKFNGEYHGEHIDPSDPSRK